MTAPTQVNITLKWTPGDLASNMPLEPTGEPVTDNPLGSDGSAPIEAGSGVLRAPSQAPAALPEAGVAPQDNGSVTAPAKAAEPDVLCKQKLGPWDQCGGWPGRAFAAGSHLGNRNQCIGICCSRGLARLGCMHECCCCCANRCSQLLHRASLLQVAQAAHAASTTAPFPETCCTAGFKCVRQNEWFHQCVPEGPVKRRRA